jgi:hypothetical protein
MPTPIITCTIDPSTCYFKQSQGEFVGGFTNKLEITNLGGDWDDGSYVLSVREELQGDALAYGELVETDGAVKTYLLDLSDVLTLFNGYQSANLWIQLVDTDDLESYSPPTKIKVWNTAYEIGETPPVPGPEPEGIEDGEALVWDADAGNWAYVDLATAAELALKQDILAEGEFEDGDKTKLDGIEEGATADQTPEEIEAIIKSQKTVRLRMGMHIEMNVGFKMGQGNIIGVNIS